MNTADSSRTRIFLFLALTLATLLAVALRCYGVSSQVLIDDEFHALHKLVDSTYADIAQTFGLADHSIPLTLFYKFMSETVGLTEGRMRFLQVASGIALVPAAGWFAWRATGDAPAAGLFAFLLSGAPFLVLWSRFARPYAITLLLVVICVASIWRWRSDRTLRMAAIAAMSASLAAWLHPISGLYAAIACAFVFVEDTFAPAGVRPRPSLQSSVLGVTVAVAMLVPLAAPLLNDLESLTWKAGGDQPGFDTYERMFAIIWGGVPTPVVAIASVVALWGVGTFFRRDRPLTSYLVLMGIVPATYLTLSGAFWMQEGQTFLRYQLPCLPLVLFFGSIGAVSLARLAAPRIAEVAAWIVAVIVSGAYLAATPAIAQVATLGIWYSHPEYHWDYRYRWMSARENDGANPPPGFYRELGRMAPGAAPIIETPFSFAHNKLAFYATFHRQPEMFGMIHDLCLSGPRYGEPPHDARFRFHKFIYLDDVAAVRKSPARFLLFDRGPLIGQPFRDEPRCLARLTELYGPPVRIDARLAVFDLKPGEPQPAPL